VSAEIFGFTAQKERFCLIVLLLTRLLKLTFNAFEIRGILYQSQCDMALMTSLSQCIELHEVMHEN